MKPLLTHWSRLPSFVHACVTCEWRDVSFCLQGMRVVNIVGFRRGYNFLNELLALAKPFGKVVKHLVLDLRAEVEGFSERFVFLTVSKVTRQRLFGRRTFSLRQKNKLKPWPASTTPM